MIKRWFTNNFILKLVALGLAVITWIYVNDALSRNLR